LVKLRITLIKSSSGYDTSQRMTLKTLGLRKLNHSVIREDSHSLRGQIMKVKHLVTVEEYADATK
jgi:large subunit ribosomal protein L30